MKQFVLLLLFFFTFPIVSQSAEIPAESTGPQEEPPVTKYPSYQVFGFIEQDVTYVHNSDDPAAFQIRRARIGVRGDVTDRISVNVIGGVVEPPDRTPRVVGAAVDFDIHPLLQLRTGQFQVPFGIEGAESVIMNHAIERSSAIRRMNPFHMFSDIGIQASGSYNRVTYAVALINGTGANQPALSDPTTVAGRIGFGVTDGLDIGGSFHFGPYRVGENHIPAILVTRLGPEAVTISGEMSGDYDRYQLGGDVEWQIDGLFIRAEYRYRNDEIPNQDGTIGDWGQHGGYLLASYRFTQQWQGVVRYEMHQPDTEIHFDDNGLTIHTAGVNYYFDRQTRLSLNYELINDRRTGYHPGNLLTIQMQLML